MLYIRAVTPQIATSQDDKRTLVERTEERETSGRAAPAINPLLIKLTKLQARLGGFFSAA